MSVPKGMQKMRCSAAGFQTAPPSKSVNLYPREDRLRETGDGTHGMVHTAWYTRQGTVCRRGGKEADEPRKTVSNFRELDNLGRLT